MGYQIQHSNFRISIINIIVPQTFIDISNRRTYDRHQGIDATTYFIRDALYWPRMIADIRKVVTRWPTCIEFQPAQPSEPMPQPETDHGVTHMRASSSTI